MKTPHFPFSLLLLYFAVVLIMHHGGAEEARRKEGPEEGFRDSRPKVGERQGSSRRSGSPVRLDERFDAGQYQASHDRDDPGTHDEKTYE